MRPDESFVEQPIRSLQTMLRVLSEDNKKYPTVVPDGIYGPSTMQAVATFQRYNAMPVTGVTDQSTWDAIAAAYKDARVRVEKAEAIEILMDPGDVYRLGDSNAYIYLLQSILTQLSLDNTTINAPPHSGILDDETAEALISFQKLAQLAQTGELDRNTWKHLVRHFTLSAHHNMRTEKKSK